MYVIHLSKETFKFSCSHFTILAADRAERLHGHNYQVRVDISVENVDSQLGMAFDFNLVKPIIRDLCDRMDERILLPTRSPFVSVKSLPEGQVQIGFNGKHYSFPADDTLLLPLANVTTEELARYAGAQLVDGLRSLPFWTDVTVTIEETRGQSVSFTSRR